MMKRPDDADRAKPILTRGQVASQLRLSPAMIRILERDGTLHPVFDRNDTPHFTQEEVERVALDRHLWASAPGDLAARVFAAFRSGKDLAAIVVEMRIPPAIVRALHHEFVTPLGPPAPPTAAHPKGSEP